MSDLDARELVEQVRRCADALEMLAMHLAHPLQAVDTSQPLPKFTRSARGAIAAVEAVTDLEHIEHKAKPVFNGSRARHRMGRRLAMKLMREELEMSLTAIGRVLHCDHSTVFHNLEVAQRMYETNMVERSFYEQSKNRLAPLLKTV